MADIEADVWGEGERDLLQEIAALSGPSCAPKCLVNLAVAHSHNACSGAAADDIARRTRLLENEIRVLKDENQRLSLEQQGNKEKLKDNQEKIKLNKQLPYLVGNVVEILDQVPEVRLRSGSRGV
jgi:ATP-dependent 26S proteasome regulatory subunit